LGAPPEWARPRILQPKPKSTPSPSGERESTSAPPRRSSGPAPREGSLRPEGPGDLVRRPRPDDPIVLDTEPGAFLFGSWKNLFIAIWESQPTMPGVDRMFRATTVMNGLHPSGRSTVHIIASGAGLPTSEVRAHFANTAKKSTDNLACVAVVVGGTGFWTSALRSFVTGLRWLDPRSFDFRMTATIEEVAKWLPVEHARRTGVELDARRLVEVIAGWAAPRNRSS